MTAMKLPLSADFKTAKSLRRKVWRRAARHKRHMRIYPFIEFKHKLTFGPFDVAHQRSSQQTSGQPC